MSSWGTGVRDCRKMKMTVARIGIASRRFDGWGLKRDVKSLVGIIRIKKAEKRASSRYTYTVSFLVGPAANQSEVKGKSSCTPLVPLGRVRQSPISGCEAIATRYGMVCFFHTRTAGRAITDNRITE